MLTRLKKVLGRIQVASAVKKAVRTGVVTTITLFVPGLLGWLHALTSWASSHGQAPLPNGHNLAYLGVTAIAGGLTATVNFVVLALEDASGTGLLRDDVPSKITAVDPAPLQD